MDDSNPSGRQDDDDGNDPDESDWNPDPATVPCPECNGEVSEEADRCPDCGYHLVPANVNASRSAWYKVAIAFIIGLLIWTIFSWR